MHFDTNPRVLNTLNQRLRLDPMVLGWTMTKIGEKPEDILGTGEKTIEVTKQKSDILASPKE